jgi:hypothetical protein
MPLTINNDAVLERVDAKTESDASARDRGGWPRLLTCRHQQHGGCPALAFFARAGVGNACIEWV